MPVDSALEPRIRDGDQMALFQSSMSSGSSSTGSSSSAEAGWLPVPLEVDRPRPSAVMPGPARPVRAAMRSVHHPLAPVATAAGMPTGRVMASSESAVQAGLSGTGATGGFHFHAPMHVGPGPVPMHPGMHMPMHMPPGMVMGRSVLGSPQPPSSPFIGQGGMLHPGRGFFSGPPTGPVPPYPYPGGSMRSLR
jgi:hypothetical protein